MGVSNSADPGSHCYTISRKGDIHPVHYSDPTHTRTYIPAPFHNLLCTYPPTSGHSPSIGSSTSLPELCQVWIDHTSHPLSYFIHLPMKMELIEGSETSAIRTQAPRNYPNVNILHSKCCHWKGEMNCLLFRWAKRVAVNNMKCFFVFLAPLESSWGHIIIYGVLGCAEFLDLLKGSFIGNKFISPEKCLRIISTNLSETVLTSWRIQQDIITEDVRSSCKVPDRWLNFNKLCIFKTDFDKNFQYKTSEKLLSIGSRLVP